MLSAIEGNYGILVECAKRVWSFAHLTFQEYFTAAYIFTMGDESRKNLVQQYFEAPKWREVFILLANLLPTADELCSICSKK